MIINLIKRSEKLESLVAEQRSEISEQLILCLFEGWKRDSKRLELIEGAELSRSV